MDFIDNVVNNIENALRFKDVVFYKENSDLENRFNALTKLNNEYPNNDKVLSEIYLIKKGLEGENEISYELKKSNIGMYVLRDIKIKYKDLTAQIDYIIITPVYTYYVECKNLLGNITVTDKGDFIREYNYNGKKIKKGMYSPLRQVEAQREVLRKIWESNSSKIKKIFQSNNFDFYKRVLVVAANKETILNTSKAPKDIKNKVIRSDALVKKIEYDFYNRNSSEVLDGKKEMENIAKSYIELSSENNMDYYEYYKNKFIKETVSNTKLKDTLILFRKNRAIAMNIPAYYIFTNDELDKIVELKPKTIDELRNAKILTNIKIQTHGAAIINEIKNILSTKQ